jgi:hypothetical protein
MRVERERGARGRGAGHDSARLEQLLVEQLLDQLFLEQQQCTVELEQLELGQLGALLQLVRQQLQLQRQRELRDELQLGIERLGPSAPSWAPA